MPVRTWFYLFGRPVLPLTLYPVSPRSVLQLTTNAWLAMPEADGRFAVAVDLEQRRN